MFNRAHFAFFSLFCAVTGTLFCGSAAYGYAAAVPPAPPTCRPLSAEWIFGRDIAAAVPSLANLPPELHVGYAPVAGLERVFQPAELRRLARANQLPDPRLAGNICFAWPLATLPPADIRAAMESALAGRHPQVEILAQSSAPVPAGVLVFPLAGLSALSDKPAIWKGYILYAGTRRFSTWASVLVRIRETHLFASAAIPVGSRMTATQWRGCLYEGPIPRDLTLTDPAQAAGLIARRNIPEGAALLAGMFEAPKEVERGDLVTVLAESGTARVVTQGVALLAGRRGDVIPVRNPKSGKIYRARIEETGKVLVVPGGASGLVSEAAGPEWKS